ncbi:hypothetical protein HPB48_004877 [Haemaphysalis longicornis]|uniref:Uncharacterized protein n=1 Tax=Haemaphysalis longicornis TaxID=44386 RepID=A0A9J6H699_HAELO|nr:hypothetical protein HPB48_004877 [Haemaphysalis longicornis]
MRAMRGPSQARHRGERRGVPGPNRPRVAVGPAERVPSGALTRRCGTAQPSIRAASRGSCALAAGVGACARRAGTWTRGPYPAHPRGRPPVRRRRPPCRPLLRARGQAGGEAPTGCRPWGATRPTPRRHRRPTRDAHAPRAPTRLAAPPSRGPSSSAPLSNRRRLTENAPDVRAQASLLARTLVLLSSVAAKGHHLIGRTLMTSSMVWAGPFFSCGRTVLFARRGYVSALLRAQRPRCRTRDPVVHRA